MILKSELASSRISGGNCHHEAESIERFFSELIAMSIKRCLSEFYIKHPVKRQATSIRIEHQADRW